MSIERDFDVTMIAGLALREKQIQQNYRPIIGVHKWFSLRPGTLYAVCSWPRYLVLPVTDWRTVGASGIRAFASRTRSSLRGPLG